MDTTYTLEDFDTIKPYEELEKIENPFQKQLAEKKLEEQAKLLGFKYFKKMLAGYRKSLKCPLDIVSDGRVTDFQGQETELRLRTWNADETGVWRVGRDNVREYACAHPIYPCQLLRNIDTGELKVKLRYRRGNDPAWTTQVVDFDTVANARNIVNLSKIGVSVTSGARAQNLVDYINEAIDENYDSIEKIQSVTHLGWNCEGFSPYIDDVEFDGNANFDKIFRAVSRKGSLEEWIDELCRVRKYSITAHIVVAASFASALIKPLGVTPFFVHLWGMASGTGKTVAQMVGASVWGDPTRGGGLFPSFKGTSTGFELQAGFLHSLPFFIDELQLAKDRTGKVNFNVYELSSGFGKLRGTKTLGIAGTPTWNNCFITSGETPIVGDQDGSGAVNRVIEVECGAGSKVIEDGHHTANFVLKHYGYGGKIFIHKLLEENNLDLARKLYDLRYQECTANKATEKQAMAAATILTADALAAEWIFGDDALTTEQMSEFMKTEQMVSAAERGYRYICDWVAINHNRFGTDIENGDVYGTIEDDYAYIIRSAFDRACADKGINSKALLSHLKSKGLIQTRGDGKSYTKHKRIFAGGAPVPCIVLRLLSDGEMDVTQDYPEF